MSSSDTNINLNNLKNQLEAIEKQCSSSSLVIYVPMQEHEQFFNDLCVKSTRTRPIGNDG